MTSTLISIRERQRRETYRRGGYDAMWPQAKEHLEPPVAGSDKECIVP